MGFRCVVIKNRSKLDLRMNYLVCRNAEEEKQIYIPEISTLILDSTAISLTCALISELIKNDVKIIFCDEKHNPESEAVPYHTNYNSVANIKKQINWQKHIKEEVWKEIVKEKIKQQRDFLTEKGFTKEAKLLDSYINNVLKNDKTNREGHAAKVYFNALFGQSFARRDQNFINSALNYGYSVILSCFNREVAKLGYLTQIGIWHKNEFNFFNLSSDLMEPFRILIDRAVYNFTPEENDFKMEILEIFNLQVRIDGKMQYFENAVEIYCQSIFNALEDNNAGLMKFYEM